MTGYFVNRKQEIQCTVRLFPSNKPRIRGKECCINMVSVLENCVYE